MENSTIAWLVGGAAALAGVGYLVTRDERNGPSAKKGAGWYATAYDRVTKEKPKGRAKEYEGPFDERKEAVAAVRAFTRKGWKGKGVRTTVAFRQTTPF